MVSVLHKMTRQILLSLLGDYIDIVLVSNVLINVVFLPPLYVTTLG